MKMNAIVITNNVSKLNYDKLAELFNDIDSEFNTTVTAYKLPANKIFSNKIEEDEGGDQECGKKDCILVKVYKDLHELRKRVLKNRSLLLHVDSIIDEIDNFMAED